MWCEVTCLGQCQYPIPGGTLEHSVIDGVYVRAAVVSTDFEQWQVVGLGSTAGGTGTVMFDGWTVLGLQPATEHETTTLADEVV